MELVNEWLPTEKIRKVDTHFRIESTNEKELIYALTLTGNELHKAEMEYHEKFGHTIGQIQHISLMSRIEICYTDCRLATQTAAPTLPGFQGIKRCIQYLDMNPHKPIFNTYNSCNGSNTIILR